IADDGRGVDVGALVAKMALAQPSRIAALPAMDEDEMLALVFEPGLSSRDDVTTLSGRGVGMDVVRSNVEQIGGRIALSNRPGQGLTVTLEVPLTLAILNAVLVQVAGTRFAIPRQSVDEIVQVGQGGTRIDRVGGHGAVAMLRGERLSMVSLPEVIGMAHGAASPRYLAVVSLRQGRFALAIDAVDDTQELVVKPAAPPVMRAGIYAGQMLPDDGVPVLLLDCAGIAQRAGLVFETVREQVAETAVAQGVPALLFDDVDGARRMIVSDAVDRIERIEPG
ncbi:hypothetical protein LTR94_028991, partial [Friedmanniomyces endolithicus]